MKLNTLPLLLILFFSVFFTKPLQAQTGLKAADRLFDQMEYARAIEAYKKIFKENGPSLEVTEKLGDCYRLTGNTKEAENWYELAVNYPRVKPTTFLRYGLVVQQNENYEKARTLFEEYAVQDPTQADYVQKLKDGCDSAMVWLARPHKVEVTKEYFNSENSDFSPVYYKGGLVFSSDRPRKSKTAGIYGWTGKPYLQLYSLARDTVTKGWGQPVLLSNRINTAYHNANATFSAFGDTIFFTRTNKVKDRRKTGNSDPTSWQPVPAKDQYVNRLEIYFSEYNGTAWNVAKPFAYNKVKEYSVAHPALSPDEETLYFISDMPGGFGGSDIYFCTRQTNGGWSKPKNCGPTINTPGKEVFPTVGPDGTLYFSSDSHIGMGGLDLFSAKGFHDEWHDLTNMQVPFNSGGDDFGITFDKDGKDGFLSSNRNNESGLDDIYSFKPIRPACKVDGLVMEQRSVRSKEKSAPLSQVMLRLYSPGDTIGKVTYSDKAGHFTFQLQEGIDYTIKAFKDGYLTTPGDVGADCKSVIKMIRSDAAVQIVSGKTYRVDNIYYDLDKYNIRPESAKELNKIVMLLHDNPRIKIELSSHTDSRAGARYNLLLSQLRAEEVVRYIVSKGINQNRLQAKGYGETQLLNKCGSGVKCKEEEHQLNRRTEFKFIR
jgi:outer membrane protein OmpA-like peptidoglycan-associated protein/tetratricopeptide (TPR) repeat protein